MGVIWQEVLQFLQEKQKARNKLAQIKKAYLSYPRVSVNSVYHYVSPVLHSLPYDTNIMLSGQ